LRLLLDTHIWLWSKLEPKRLGRKLLPELSDVNNELWLSPVSVWEALVLMQKGRIQVDNPFTWIERAAEQMREAPLTREIVSAGLAGTAKILKLTLVTADQKLLGLGEIASLANR
jgi:PIN domain nuclease of toxin-antitoxin system